jgi:hypothetical protein
VYDFGNQNPALLVEVSMTSKIFESALGSILIEPEVHGDAASPFRVFVNNRLMGEGLTPADVLRMVGDVLERSGAANAAKTVPIEDLNASNDE